MPRRNLVVLTVALAPQVAITMLAPYHGGQNVGSLLGSV